MVAETEPLFEDLLARYAEPHRHYHDVRHLAEVLGVVDEFADHAADVEVVRLAAWFHDAVYDPHRADNEHASAHLAAQSLVAAGWPDEATMEVVRLVLLTATHNPAPGDRNGELLCDADLAILAAEPARYAAYTAGVRAEHADVEETSFTLERRLALRALLGLPALFRIPAVHARWEQAARANVAAELASLEPTP